MGHRNISNLVKAVQDGFMVGTGVTAADLQQYRDDRRNNTLRHVCEGCALGKMHKNAVNREKALRASKKLQLVHLDLVGPFKKGAIGNKLITIVNLLRCLLMTTPGWCVSMA